MRRFALVLFLIFSVTIALGRPSYDVVPAWVDKALADMKGAGLLVGSPEGLCGPRPPSRYEHAVATFATYATLKSTAEQIVKTVPSSPEQKAKRKKALKKLALWRAHVGALQSLAKEFDRELSSLGVDTADMRRDLAALERFCAGDQTSSNWAIPSLSFAGFLAGAVYLRKHLRNLRPSGFVFD